MLSGWSQPRTRYTLSEFETEKCLAATFCRHPFDQHTTTQRILSTLSIKQITFLSNKWIMPPKESKLEKAREVVDILEEISMLLVCTYPNLTNASLIKSRTHSSTVHSCLGASLFLRMVSIPKLWRYVKILLSDGHL